MTYFGTLYLAFIDSEIHGIGYLVQVLFVPLLLPLTVVQLDPDPFVLRFQVCHSIYRVDTVIHTRS